MIPLQCPGLLTHKGPWGCLELRLLPAQPYSRNHESARSHLSVQTGPEVTTHMFHCPLQLNWIRQSFSLYSSPPSRLFLNQDGKFQGLTLPPVYCFSSRNSQFPPACWYYGVKASLFSHLSSKFIIWVYNFLLKGKVAEFGWSEHIWSPSYFNLWINTRRLSLSWM